MDKPLPKKNNFFEMFATKATQIAGSTAAFILAVLVVITWIVTGPLFKYSDTWQLAINTGTTIVTFLMVFVIQQSQNKDTLALHLKMNELIAASKNASNRLVNIEDLTPIELATLKEFYSHLSVLAKSDKDLFSSHSIDEAQQNHKQKMHTGSHVKEAPQNPQLTAP